MSDIFILGFTDELVKLAQNKRPEGYYSPKAVMKRMGPGPMGPPKPQAAGPRPAPGTRMPKPVYPEKTWTPKPKQRKATGIPKAEGIVQGTFQRQLPALPSGKKMPKAKGIVSEVGARKKWEAKVKKEENKLPGWLSDEMKKPVKDHPMAKPEAVARSKKEDAEAKKLVAGFVKKKPKKGGRRVAKGTYGPTREDLWRMVPGKTKARMARGGGKTGPTGIFAPHRTSPYPAGGTEPYKKLPGGGYRQSYVRRPMTVPGYKAVAKKRTI